MVTPPTSPSAVTSTTGYGYYDGELETRKTQFNTKLSQWKIGNELGAFFGPPQRALDHGLDVGRAVARLAPADDAPRPARRPFS